MDGSLDFPPLKRKEKENPMKRTLLILATTLFAIGTSSSVLAHQPVHQVQPVHYGQGHNDHRYYDQKHHGKKHHGQKHHKSKHHRHYSSHQPVYGVAHLQAQQVYRHQYQPRYYQPRPVQYGHPVSGRYGSGSTLRLDNVLQVSLQSGH